MRHLERSFHWVAVTLLTGLVSETYCAERPNIRWRVDYADAQRARIENKQPMLVFMTLDSCPHCHQMLETTYQNATIARGVSEFIPTFINGGQQHQLAKQFGVRIYPTTFLIDPDNRIVDRIEGYMDAKQLGKRLDRVSRELAKVARNGSQEIAK